MSYANTPYHVMNNLSEEAMIIQQSSSSILWLWVLSKFCKKRNTYRFSVCLFFFFFPNAFSDYFLSMSLNVFLEYFAPLLYFLVCILLSIFVLYLYEQIRVFIISPTFIIIVPKYFTYKWNNSNFYRFILLQI